MTGIKKFDGPLFIVGLSRSGTKLLRDILNRHPNIGIPEAESHFIPYIVKHYGTLNLRKSTKDRDRLLKTIKTSNFYNRMLKQDLVLDLNDKTILESQNIAGVIENLMRNCVNVDDKRHQFIWGDKTPNNLLHMKLLSDFFPEAKFVHILRDPRARALSAKKAWGANICYSAHRWNSAVFIARNHGLELGANYSEVLYENLVVEPESELATLCQFLGVSFDEAMLTLEKPVENFGDNNSATRKSNKIYAGHIENFRKELDVKELSRIDEITFPMASQLGYIRVEDNVNHIPLKNIERACAILSDRWNTWRSHLRLRGVIKTIRFLWWHKKVDLKIDQV